MIAELAEQGTVDPTRPGGASPPALIGPLALALTGPGPFCHAAVQSTAIAFLQAASSRVTNGMLILEP